MMDIFLAAGATYAIFGLFWAVLWGTFYRLGKGSTMRLIGNALLDIFIWPIILFLWVKKSISKS